MTGTEPEQSATSSSLEIHLLGHFRMLVDRQAVDERSFTRRKPKLLIKLLALQPNHQLHREQAMEFLWPDSDPESAANNLHKAIHMARHALEPSLKLVADSHFILTQEQQVILRAPGVFWIDVNAFEQRLAVASKSQEVGAYEEARALYEGELLPEDRYEDWAAPRREQLCNAYQELLANLARLYETRGEHQLAIERLKELLGFDSANEETHRQLMRLYALNGNKHQALKQYQLCSEVLQKELGEEPEQATRDLRQQIISGQLAPVSSARQDKEPAKEQTAVAKQKEAGPSTLASPSQSWWSTRATKILLVLITLVVAAAGYLLLRSVRVSKEATALKHPSFTQLTDQPGPEFFPSLSPDGVSLVYSSRASGNWDIYLQRVGGRNPINLTRDSPADDTQPAFSPDGERIVFRSEREGGGIYSMGATGESVIRVSDFGYSPSWSSDGKQILVGTEKIPQPSTRPTKSQLWMINFESGERRLLTEGDALQPSCSPHKQRIAYWSRSSRAGQREAISTIPVNGGEAVPVTNGSTTDLNPVWSPDGKYLYFSSNRGGSMNIWRVAIDEKSGATLGEPEAVTTIGAATSAHYLSFSRDGRRLAYVAQEDIRNLRSVAFDPATGKVGSEPVSITRGTMQLWFPDVSPDGEWLTACSRGQNRHVFILRTDGTDLRDLTDDNYRNDGWPRWSPDGKRIVFTSRRSGDYELWLINRDGSGLQRLTQSFGGHYSAWSRDGSMIAYSIHTPKNECVIIQPDKTWSEQQPVHLPLLSDASLSFEGWSWSPDGKKLAGIRHMPNGVHSGIGIYDRESKNYDWLTDFGDWPVWFNDGRRLLFVSEGKIFLFDTGTRKYQPVLTVTDQDVDIGSPALSANNRMIYFTFVAAEADVWLMTLE